MTKHSRIRQLLESTPFPGAGEKLGKVMVRESVVDIEGRNWEIHLEGKLNPLQVRKALKELTGSPHGVEVSGKYALVYFEGKGMSHVRTNPPGDLTVVRGHMYYARPNPTTPKVFKAEMDEMITDTPEKFFTVHEATGDKSLKDKLWSFVTYTGESYGWYKDGEIYHRRASIIMPKIKINKALEGATMFYHTHPYKDEPSLTSADDIQFYLDLHFAFGIKTFYTVMKHKMDKFTITGKKGGEEKYLRMDEEVFVDAVDGLIEIGERSSKKNVPKNTPETDHQNHVTKVMVEEFNKKYKSIASIKYSPSVKKNSAKRLARSSPLDSLMALSNPRPNPPIVLEDKYVAKALEELQGLDYAFEHYGGDEYAHTMYVYWWLKHHLFPTPQYPKGRLFKLQEYGMDQDTRTKLREYLNTTAIGNYTYLDVVMLIGLYHDIAKLREKQPGAKPGHIIGAEMFRNEVAPELNLPSKLTEDIAHILESDVGRKGITDEQFLMESGHYYAAAKLMQMADVVTHHPLMFTGSARKAKAEGRIGTANGQKYKDYAMTEIVNDIRDFIDHGDVPRQNPPPKATVVRWVGNYDQAFSMPIVEVNLEEFDYRNVPNKDGDLGEKQGGIGGHLFYMRFNSTTIPSIPEGRVITANLALNTGNLLITIGSPVPQDDLGKQIANDIYVEVGMQLKASYPELVIEEPEPEMLVNPMLSKKIQLITLSGPSGVGKSTVLKFLANSLPNASTPPTYTTRPRRPTDGQDRIHISREEFMDGVQRGEFVEWEPSGSGHLYGKKFKDFSGSVAIIDVTIGGKRKYAKAFPNMFSIFLDPDPNVSVTQRAKKLYQRGGMSKEEAKKRASIAHSMVQTSKKMDFDLRMVMKHGDYEKNAERILGEIPLNNPDLKDFGLDPGETPEEQREREERLAAEKERIRLLEEAEAAEAAEREARHVETPMAHLDQTLEERNAVEQERLDRNRVEAQQRAEEEGANRASTARLDSFENPPILRINKVYHATPKANLSSIMEKGLLMSPMIGTVEPANYFTYTLGQGIRMKKRRENSTYSGKKQEHVLLEVDIRTFDNKDVGAEPYEYRKHPEFNERLKEAMANTNQLMITQDIPSRYISVVPQKTIDDYWEREEAARKNPKDLFSWFKDWVELVNMKNKELKAFLDSDWGKVAGLSKQEAKDWNNIKSGRVSGRRILKMRKKLGLTGPKDYIKLGPRIIEDYYEKALDNWTGPSNDMQKGETDWDWCKRQVRFNKRFMGDNFGKRKGPLVKKQKTQNQPSRRLLSLWVWGHDPWRYARKVEKRAKMPKCPDVPWVGRTEKIKYGKIEVIPGPRKNPVRQNIPRPARSVGFTRKDIVYSGDGPYTLSANLLKAIKKTRHQSREYFGFASANSIWYGTNFEVSTAGEFQDYEDKRKFIKENDIWLSFHTHPINLYTTKERLLSDIPSPPDHVATLANYLDYGIVAEVVSTAHGFFVIEPVFKSGKKEQFMKKSIEERRQYFYKYADKVKSAWDTWNPYEDREWRLGPRTPGHLSARSTAYINTLSEYFAFNETFYDSPILALKWKPSKEEGMLRGTLIKVNPHYTPPPGIAMFPGEMPMGPAALYQQTVSISQLQGLQRVSPSVLANGRRNPRTKKGRKFPKKYLKNLTPTEKAIAMYEIDRGYEYDEDDPEAYKFWESDIKSKARGLKTVPSKWRNKFAKKYGPLKEGKDFLTRISKTTGIKRAIIKKIHDKGLAAWRVGHRPGVQQHQWAAGRVYAFVMGADSSTGPGKPDHKLAVEAGVR